MSTKIKNTATRVRDYAKARYEAGEPERQKRREEAYKASLERGKKSYEKGFSHSKNILKAVGKMTIKSIGFGMASGGAEALGMKTVSKLLYGAGLVSNAMTVRDAYENARDYERYRKVRT